MRRFEITGRWHRGPWIAAALALALAPDASEAGPPPSAIDLRLNQVQVIGSHNSYHIAPTAGILELIGGYSSAKAEALDYTHPPLVEQFGRRGIRQIELDVFADPKGGLFADPYLRGKLKDSGKDPGPDPNAGGVLNRPGMKVLHVQDVDFLSHAPTFVEALRQVQTWSRANPHHVPILVLVELKDESRLMLPTKPVAFDRALVDAVDAEILSVFDRKEIITPDYVRGVSATLPEAIRARGWPRLDEVRGRVMFALDNEGDIRDLYTKGHPALKDRILFVTADSPTAPEAAWFKVNDPVGDYGRIRQLVADGFLVRTRADADTRQSRENDPKQRDRALASGAQFVSTDYPVPDRRFSEYCVRLPGGVVARVNPVCADPAWGRIDLETGKPPADR